MAGKAVKKASRAAPLPTWINTKQMAASCGISVQAFSQWGVPKAGAIGREVFYTVDDVIENRIAKARERWEASQPPPSPEDLQADKERTLLVREQRIGQELKNAQTRRELAPVALIDWTLSKVGAQISAILESIPLKVKKMLPRLTATEVEHIKRELVKAQNAAARVTVDLDEYYERDPDGSREVDPPRAQSA